MWIIHTSRYTSTRKNVWRVSIDVPSVMNTSNLHLITWMDYVYTAMYRCILVPIFCKLVHTYWNLEVYLFHYGTETFTEWLGIEMHCFLYP